MKTPITRRSALGKLARSAAVVAATAASLQQRLAAADAAAAGAALKGRVNHSVCKWCYKLEVEELCRAGKEMGLTSVELLNPPDFPTLK